MSGENVTTLTSRIYYEGKYAAKTGRTKVDCPYEDDRKIYWLKGFVEAKKELSTGVWYDVEESVKQLETLEEAIDCIKLIVKYLKGER